MIDISKIADIILLMIDGNFGFEMETMEFLNALSAHGMPGNVFGILTHLDLFRKPSTLKDAKKRLKHRFWSELYQGAKLFYLSGVINGRYPDREVHNLSRFLSVMKNPRPLIWRNSHPYCLADRFLDVTPPTTVEENPKCDRTVALYGYLRGTNLAADGARVHIPGAGDFNVSAVESLPDPCPTPFMDQAIAKASGKAQRRRLGEKQKVLFAPMSDVGGVLVDKDAVYIDVKTSTFDKDIADREERGLGEQMVVGLQSERRLLGEAVDGVKLFTSGNLLKDGLDHLDPNDDGRRERRKPRVIDSQDDENDVSLEEEGYVSSAAEDHADSLEHGDVANDKLGKAFQGTKDDAPDRNINGNLAFADSDSDIGSLSSNDNQEMEDDLENSEYEGEDDDEEEEEAALRWKSNIKENAQKLHSSQKQYRISDFARMLYDESLTPAEVVRKWKGLEILGATASETHEEDGQEDENFFRHAEHEDEEENLEDRSIPPYDYAILSQKWSDPGNIERLRQRFVTANLLRESGGASDNENESDDEDDGDGDFQDLEAKPGSISNDAPADVESTMEGEREKNARKKEELKLRFEEEDREGFGKQSEPKDDGNDDDEEFGEDDWYDAQKAQIQKQLTINRAEMESMDPNSRARVEGFRAGTYARIVLERVPYEFAAAFNPRNPIILGGLTPTEDRFGFVQVRIKRHRWHKKILKTNDPLIFSLGWRRFQTVPVYSVDDSRTRNRMLKYTPEHMHCFGTFYGPLIAPNTGFCCVQSFSNQNPGFRIAASGVVLNVDESSEIVKKLKLTGVPYKIFKNTAFVRDMFSTALEIAKFEGASIRTVSGIRGQIKRALSKPEGNFRATFEDKVLMSDIIFLRAWYPVKPHKFYNPVTNLLENSPSDPAGEDRETESGWKSMRLTGQVRADANIPTPSQPNSAYRSIDRPNRPFNPHRVPRSLAADLPFKSQIIQMAPQRKQTYLQKRAVVLGGEEKRARNLMQKIMTIRKEKVAKRKVKQEERKEPYRRKMRENEEKKAEREKRERDAYWRREGKKRRQQDEGAGGSRGGKRVKR